MYSFLSYTLQFSFILQLLFLVVVGFLFACLGFFSWKKQQIALKHPGICSLALTSMLYSLKKRTFYLTVSHGEALVTFCPSMYPCLLHSDCPVLSFQDTRSFSASIFLSSVAFLTAASFELMFS